MDRGAWQATVHGVAELDMTEWLTLNYEEAWEDTQVQNEITAETESVYSVQVSTQIPSV